MIRWPTKKNLNKDKDKNKEKQTEERKERATRNERVKEVFRKEINKLFPTLKVKAVEERAEKEMMNYILKNQGKKTLNYWYSEKPSEITDYTNWETKPLYMKQIYELDIDTETKLQELQSMDSPKDLSNRLLNPLYKIDTEILQNEMIKIMNTNTQFDQEDLIEVLSSHITCAALQQTLINSAEDKDKLIKEEEWTFNNIFTKGAKQCFEGSISKAYLTEVRNEFEDEFMRIKSISYKKGRRDGIITYEEARTLLNILFTNDEGINKWPKILGTGDPRFDKTDGSIEMDLDIEMMESLADLRVTTKPGNFMNEDDREFLKKVTAVAIGRYSNEIWQINKYIKDGQSNKMEATMDSKDRFSRIRREEQYIEYTKNNDMMKIIVGIETDTENSIERDETDSESEREICRGAQISSTPKNIRKTVLQKRRRGFIPSAPSNDDEMELVNEDRVQVRSGEYWSLITQNGSCDEEIKDSIMKLLQDTPEDKEVKKVLRSYEEYELQNEERKLTEKEKETIRRRRERQIEKREENEKMKEFIEQRATKSQKKKLARDVIEIERHNDIKAAIVDIMEKLNKERIEEAKRLEQRNLQRAPTIIIHNNSRSEKESEEESTNSSRISSKTKLSEREKLEKRRDEDNKGVRQKRPIHLQPETLDQDTLMGTTNINYESENSDDETKIPDYKLNVIANRTYVKNESRKESRGRVEDTESESEDEQPMKKQKKKEIKKEKDDDLKMLRNKAKSMYSDMKDFSEGEDGEIFIKNVYRLANQMLSKEPLQREMYHFLFDKLDDECKRKALKSTSVVYEDAETLQSFILEYLSKKENPQADKFELEKTKVRDGKWREIISKLEATLMAVKKGMNIFGSRGRREAFEQECVQTIYRMLSPTDRKDLLTRGILDRDISKTDYHRLKKELLSMEDIYDLSNAGADEKEKVDANGGVNKNRYTEIQVDNIDYKISEIRSSFGNKLDEITEGIKSNNKINEYKINELIESNKTFKDVYTNNTPYKIGRDTGNKEEKPMNVVVNVNGNGKEVGKFQRKEVESKKNNSEYKSNLYKDSNMNSDNRNYDTELIYKKETEREKQHGDMSRGRPCDICNGNTHHWTTCWSGYIQERKDALEKNEGEQNKEHYCIGCMEDGHKIEKCHRFVITKDNKNRLSAKFGIGRSSIARGPSRGVTAFRGSRGSRYMSSYKK